MLKAGNGYDGETGDFEYGITILTGTCDITGEGFEFKSAGKRMNVFEGNATAVYIPKGTKFSVKAVTDVRIVITACPAEKNYTPYIVNPEDVIVKHFGKPGFEREVHFIMDERFEGNRVYIGENYIKGNEWTGFPGHKHDENTDNEK
ncbi:MAG: 5-deoxy-glucuronate isomerase, partial [Clostridia bacterium]|nr:5-deoxy-glucuronate isomerase [Clostridia bacterium]